MTNQTTPRQQAARQTNGRQAAAQPAAPVTPPAAASPQPAIPATPPAQPAPAPVTFSEAPSSINLRFDYKGYEGIQLTLRDVSGSQLLHKLDAVLGKLEAMGATPTAERKRGGQPQTSESSAPAADEAGAPPVCQYHGPMKPSTKKAGSWYCPAKMGDGSYCKSKSG